MVYLSRILYETFFDFFTGSGNVYNFQILNEITPAFESISHNIDKVE